MVEGLLISLVHTLMITSTPSSHHCSASTSFLLIPFPQWSHCPYHILISSLLLVFLWNGHSEDQVHHHTTSEMSTSFQQAFRIESHGYFQRAAFLVPMVRNQILISGYSWLDFKSFSFRNLELKYIFLVFSFVTYIDESTKLIASLLHLTGHCGISQLTEDNIYVSY